jgi:hypothetical protein
VSYAAGHSQRTFNDGGEQHVKDRAPGPSSAGACHLLRKRAYETLEYAIADKAARDDAAVRCVVFASTHPTKLGAGGNLDGFAADVPLPH